MNPSVGWFVIPELGAHVWVLDDLDGKAGQLEIDVIIRGGQTLKTRMDEAGIKLTAGTAVITMAVDDGITIAFPSAKVTLTANE